MEKLRREKLKREKLRREKLKKDKLKIDQLEICLREAGASPPKISSRCSQTGRAQKMKWLSLVLPFLRPAFELAEEPASSFTKTIREAEKSLVRIRLSNSSISQSEGTGFFIGETAIATNFHVIHEMKDCRKISIQTPSGLETAFRGIKHLSALNDLAVLETEGLPPLERPTHGPALKLAGELDSFPGDEAYILGFPRGKLRRIKAELITNDGFNYFCAANFSEDMRGGSGGPFLNRKGKVMGVFYIASGNMCYGSQVKFLKQLLSQPPLPHTKKPETLIKTEMARLESFAKKVKGMEGAEARFRMALSLLEKRHHAKSRREILNWLLPAAEQGHPRAQFCLGFLFFERERKYGQAIKWLSRAAKRGLPSAQFCLGLVLLEKKDESGKEALKWIRKAADQGYSEARHKLGLMLLRGENMRENFEESLIWLQAAAKQGHLEARQLLALNINLIENSPKKPAPSPANPSSASS